MLVETFLTYLRTERNSSPRTVESYSNDLRAFEQFFTSLDNSIGWLTVDGDVIRDWLEAMMDKGNKASSVNRRLSAVRTFYRFALSRQLVSRDPSYGISGPKKERPLPYFMNETDMNTILDEKMWDSNNFIDVRARTILLVFY